MEKRASWFSISITLLSMGILAMFLLVPPASAAEKYSYKVSGTGGHAEWYDCVDDGCTYTIIDAVEQAYREGNNKNSYSVLCIYEESYSGDTYSYTSGCAEDADVSVNKKLKSATASGSVPVYTYTCDTYTCWEDYLDVEVTASWEGTGALSKYKSKSQYQSGNYKSKYSDNSSYRDGAATAQIDGEDPGSSYYAYLFNTKSGYFELCNKGC